MTAHLVMPGGHRDLGYGSAQPVRHRIPDRGRRRLHYDRLALSYVAMPLKHLFRETIEMIRQLTIVR